MQWPHLSIKFEMGPPKLHPTHPISPAKLPAGALLWNMKFLLAWSSPNIQAILVWQNIPNCWLLYSGFESSETQLF